MCEMMAAAFPEPVPFSQLAGSVGELERLGIAGFGWGVSFLDGSGVGTIRGTGRFGDEGAKSAELSSRVSRLFLVHLRRPSMLSTISLADTQPFSAEHSHAFCHNGFLDRAEELRLQFAGRLEGRADSEVGWQYFLDRLEEGMAPTDALAAVDKEFGGNVNLGYLGREGTLAVYTHSATNDIWRFRLDGAEMACTSLHSSDESLFQMIFARATEQRKLEPGSSSELSSPHVAAAL